MYPQRIADLVVSVYAFPADQWFVNGGDICIGSIQLVYMAVFRIAQTLAEGRSLPSFISFLSRGSFCVYLIQPFFQLVTRERFWEALPPLWGTPLQAVLLLVLSLAAYWVLRKIPLVSRWLI